MEINKYIKQFNGLDEKIGEYRVTVTVTESDIHTHIVYEANPAIGDYALDANDTKWFFSMVNQFMTRDHESLNDALQRAIAFVALPL